MAEVSPFRGIFTIPSTPFRPDGNIDTEGFRRIVAFCVGCGAHGLVYPVNASEFTALSDRERETLAEILVDENKGRCPVIINVAAVSKEVAVRFADHARELSVDGVIAMPPYVRKRDLAVATIIDYYKAVSDAVRMPIFVQNDMPPVGTEMSTELLLRLCREIQWVQYVKEETTPSTIKLSRLIEANDGSCKGCFGGGSARYLAEEYRRGSSGNMPGCHLTDVIVALWNALEAGDQERSMRIVQSMAPMLFFQDQVPDCYKEVLKRRGVIEFSGRRNAQPMMDRIASDYLDLLVLNLDEFMTWR